MDNNCININEKNHPSPQIGKYNKNITAYIFVAIQMGNEWTHVREAPP